MGLPYSQTKKMNICVISKWVRSKQFFAEKFGAMIAARRDKPPLGFFQCKRIMQRLNRQFHIFAVNQDRDFDLGSCDHFDVHILCRK